MSLFFVGSEFWENENSSKILQNIPSITIIKYTKFYIHKDITIINHNNNK